MNEARLRFPGQPPVEHPLAAGVHGIGRVAGERLGPVDPRQAPVRICVDRRGIWLHLEEGARGVHVNGRPVRRLAMLRLGDVVFVDGAEVALVGRPQAAANLPAPGAGDPRLLLRGLGGRHHGRSYTLERPRVVGRGADADIRLEDPAAAERHARLEPHGDAVLLRDLGSAEGTLVNGVPVREALLRPGDQLAFDAHHRFVVEAPGLAGAMPAPSQPDEAAAGHVREASLAPSTRRLPWLLLAALLLAAALSALLLFGTP
ncbi:MAG TPA: FHA domain-containing protein [Xanthomonadaceae bacterium]|nr:FHA domain-containing protein [Xanthomonadaceae bacterium]